MGSTNNEYALCDSARVCLRVTHCRRRPWGCDRVAQEHIARKKEKSCVCVCASLREEREEAESGVWRLKIKTIIRFRRYAIKVTSPPPPPPKENNSFLFIEFGCMWAAWRCRCCEQAVYRGCALHYFIADPHPPREKKAAARKTRRCSRRGAAPRRHFACCPPLRESKSNGIIKSEQSRPGECARG